MAKRELTETEKLNKAEREAAQNRERVRRCREKKKAAAQVVANGQNTAQNSYEPSYNKVIARFNNLVGEYGGSMGLSGLMGAFARATGVVGSNMPTIQNERIKAISLLPADLTKEELGDALRNYNSNENLLGRVSQGLHVSSYPFFKTQKTYQDILTYRYYAAPQYIEGEEAKTKEWLREAVLVDKINKAINPPEIAHKIVGQAVSVGKVFYYLRSKVDKVHNRADWEFLQQLPQAYCTIIGYNNVSTYTISFNMMYFLLPGTDITQFGDLFMPYIDDFNEMFTEPKRDRNPNGKVVYASVPVKGRNRVDFYPQNVKTNAVGSPQVFQQNGTWFYWVSLPVDKIWTFEIDDTIASVVPPLSGLMMTAAQQSDYEAAQLSLLLNPLIKIFTGSIPYFQSQGTTIENGFRLSDGARDLFEAYFDILMRKHNTGGTAIYSAPFEDIKSHDFPESANANEVSSSFNKYLVQKSGLAGLIPLDDPKAGQAQLSALLESRYAETIYRQFERMMTHLYESLNLKYEWRFKMFGSIYTEKEIRANAEKDIANGDYSGWFILAALNGDSWIDKLSQMRALKGVDFLSMLQPPPTAYTQSNSSGGRPKNETITESVEKDVDSGDTGE